MNAHDRFEILAGAVALGEATSEERAAFDAHAATCGACRDDAGDAAYVTAKIEQAQRSETWRPSQPIVDRIRARRNRYSRFTLGALGWGVGLSLVLNVAIAGGIGTRMIGAFSPQPATEVASSAISLDAPHAALAPAPAERKPVVAYVPVRAKKVAHKAVRKHPAPLEPAARAREKLPTLDDIPDVLAGLDLYGTGSTHHVAVQSLPHCTLPPDSGAAAAADTVADDVRPCRDASGRVER